MNLCLTSQRTWFESKWLLNGIMRLSCRQLFSLVAPSLKATCPEMQIVSRQAIWHWKTTSSRQETKNGTATWIKSPCISSISIMNTWRNTLFTVKLRELTYRLIPDNCQCSIRRQRCFLRTCIDSHRKQLLAKAFMRFPHVQWPENTLENTRYYRQVN